MPEKNLQNRVALVTGGTKGIGRAIAARILDEGAHVAICGTRQKSVDDAVKFLAPRGRVFGMVADVSRLDDVRAFIATVQREFGDIHILVNNAGVGIFNSVENLAPEDWHCMIGLNLTAVYYCCHEVLPLMKKAGGGDVINISSLAGKNAFAGGAGYNASKFGLNGFAEAMMLEYREDCIRVTTILPGSVNTGFGHGGEDKDNQKNTWKIAPEDIAETVLAVLRMPRRTTISVIEIRPSRPPVKT
jgi:3-oxoacyl-[acyl-carrier protein] reductase